jgi:hypothetical protein
MLIRKGAFDVLPKEFRMDQMPKRLQELLGKDLAGYAIKPAFTLSLTKDALGLLPARVQGSKLAVVCLDREVAEEVAKKLPERTHYIEMFYCLHHEATGLAYRIHSNALLSAERLEILTKSLFDTQVGMYKDPFYWDTV